MNYTIQAIGRGVSLPSSVSFAKNNFVTQGQGGQAVVYAKDNFAYKIYHDPKHCVPLKKLEELFALATDPQIICPIGLLFDKKIPVGTMMPLVSKALPIVRLGGDTFRKNYHVTDDMICHIIRELRDRIQYVHDHHCLMTDINPGNFLVRENTFDHVQCIDVDAYGTPHFPPSAVAPAIRDFREGGFNEGTDWFSLAVLACDMLIGLNPFRGKHPQFGPKDFKKRVIARASIFDRGVVIPPGTTRDFSVIPDDYRQWFKKIFQEGINCPAPLNTPEITVLLNAPRTFIPRTWPIQLPSGRTVAVAVDKADYLTIDGHASTIKSDRIFVVENHLYSLRGENFGEIKLTEFGPRVIVSPGVIYRVLPYATTVLEGLLFQDILGSPHLTIPLRPGACLTIHVPEFIGKIIDGVYQHQHVELIGLSKGKFDRYQLQFRPDGTYTISIENDIAY